MDKCMNDQSAERFGWWRRLFPKEGDYLIAEEITRAGSIQYTAAFSFNGKWYFVCAATRYYADTYSEHKAFFLTESDALKQAQTLFNTLKSQRETWRKQKGRRKKQRWGTFLQQPETEDSETEI